MNKEIEEMQKEIEEMQKVICEHCSYENIENYPCKKERDKCTGYQIAWLFYNMNFLNEFYIYNYFF